MGNDHEYDESENTTSNPRIAQGVSTLENIIEVRLSRRGFVGGLMATSALASAGCATPSATAPSPPKENSAFEFTEILRGADERHHVPPGYEADILIRWGDPLFPGSPDFDPFAQTGESQHLQFGANNDFIGFIPLSEEEGHQRALLCVNHEYTPTHLMFPGLKEGQVAYTKTHAEAELAAHGGTIMEISKTDGRWAPVLSSPYNRRITGASTPMEISGPAAGHPRLQTREDPTGKVAAGTLNNCAGGITPWGTYLMAEENFNKCFIGTLPKGHREAQNHQRYGVTGGAYPWGEYFDRYDISKDPNEPNRYGWVVEVDPMDPTSTPKKRTALGRFKHEGAETVIAPDGRLVIYMGDDQRFDYLYKFVSARPVDQGSRAANEDLLDEGTLYVARFEASGLVTWLPLIYGEGPLNEDNGFSSQGEVLIETRKAADLLGATPMDRPEDVEPDPHKGRVWVMLTNNHQRQADQVNAANPRADNRFGHIIEIIESEGDFTATQSRWEILVKCGDPNNPAFGAVWNPNTSPNGWFGSPDNCAIDPKGRLWVSTDGNDETGANDGLWALETDGAGRGTGKAFFRCPHGAELCGPRFSDNGETLFVAVQHPGDGAGTSFEAPSTRWPDFKEDMPPRSAVVAIRRKEGGPIGG